LSFHFFNAVDPIPANHANLRTTKSMNQPHSTIIHRSSVSAIHRQSAPDSIREMSPHEHNDVTPRLPNLEEERFE